MDYQKWENSPDYHRILDVAENKWVPRVPLYEHLMGAKVIKDIMGTEPFEQMFSKDDKESVGHSVSILISGVKWATIQRPMNFPPAAF